MNTGDVRTIAAISTPDAVGGIGIVRISGKDALVIADRIFSPVSGAKVTDSPGYKAHFGKVHDGEENIDEAVCLVFRAPHSYTGEDTAEICCHGGQYVTRRVLRAAFAAGAVPAEAGEFTKRAFLNGKIDLAGSEAVMQLISAKGKQAATAALNALEGRLSKEIRKAADKLIGICASLAAWVDSPYDEIEDTDSEKMKKVFAEVFGDIEKIVSRYDCGRACTQGIDTVIAGRPNVGKSTLMNVLTGFERSIVTDIAGTTRDVVEETVRLGDVILRLADTAGMHSTDNTVEMIGVDFAKKRFERAQLVIAVFDGSDCLNDDDIKILEGCVGRAAVAVINKTDLEQKIDIEVIKRYIRKVVEISAANGDGSAELEKAVAEITGSADFDPESPCLTSERQRSCCVRAMDLIAEAIAALNGGMTLDAVTVCAECAVDTLLELTGEKASEAVVSEVFSRFCVGK